MKNKKTSDKGERCDICDKEVGIVYLCGGYQMCQPCKVKHGQLTGHGLTMGMARTIMREGWKIDK